jgi:D-arabinose 1-dehydrogenase-like Zn-dependent alcohol dehydrogenase
MAINQSLPTEQRAAQYDPKDNALHVNTIPVPSITPSQLLVKVKSASLCHSDLMALEGQALLSSDAPVTTGHEAIGEIVQIGNETKGFGLGDVVSICLNEHACIHSRFAFEFLLTVRHRKDRLFMCCRLLLRVRRLSSSPSLV